MSADEQISQLKAQVAMLKTQIQQLQKTGPVCPLCGGKGHKSTKYDSIYCHQEFGYCGELLMPVHTKRCKPNPVFHRTTWQAGEPVKPLNVSWQKEVHLHYIAGKQVSRDEYLEAIKKGQTDDNS